jgi:hypothetical protein
MYQNAINDYKRAAQLDPGFTKFCYDAIERIVKFTKSFRQLLDKKVAPMTQQ